SEQQHASEMPDFLCSPNSPNSPIPGLHITWSAVYTSAWDTTPQEYVTQGAVAWGRSRRLARITDATGRIKAYLGVQHSDPSLWGVAGEPQTRFFLSFFLDGHTLFLRTYPTFADALAALHGAYMHLAPRLA
ncbi:MAG: hypothetical protein ABI068_14120, partial [Ktedonobacterales bacterium]